MSTDGCNTTNTTVKNVTEAAWKMATTAMCGEDLAKPLLKQLEVLQEMKVAEAAVVEEEIREMLDAAKAVAAGETGDSCASSAMALPRLAAGRGPRSSDLPSRLTLRSGRSLYVNTATKDLPNSSTNLQRLEIRAARQERLA